MDGLYLLHIPRTSGTEVRSRIVSAVLDSEMHEEITLLGSDDFITNKYGSGFEEPRAVVSGINTDKKIFIFGHFATNPIREFPSINTFSIIRHPVERLESVANYLLNSANYLLNGLRKEIESDSDFERFFTSNELNWYGNSYPGFNCMPNMQSAYLTGVIASSRVDYRPELQMRGMAFNIVGTSKNIKDVIETIREKNIIISTVENRIKLIKEIQNRIFDKLNLDIVNVKNNLFDQRQIKKFKFSDQVRNKIIEENELDFQLYNLVREYELKHGSAFC